MILFCHCKNISPFDSVETFQFQDEEYVESENNNFFFAVHIRNEKTFIEIHCEKCGKNIAIPVQTEEY